MTTFSPRAGKSGKGRTLLLSIVRKITRDIFFSLFNFFFFIRLSFIAVHLLVMNYLKILCFERMGCGLKPGWAKIFCLRFLVGFFNFFLGVRIIFDDAIASLDIGIGQSLNKVLFGQDK